MPEAEQAEVVKKLQGKVAATPIKKRFKGEYAGPDKYKGKIPEGYKGKAKGKYFGKDERQGANVPVKFKPAFHKPEKLPGQKPKMYGPKKPVAGGSMPVGHTEWQKRADEARKAGKSYIQGWATS